MWILMSNKLFQINYSVCSAFSMNWSRLTTWCCHDEPRRVLFEIDWAWFVSAMSWIYDFFCVNWLALKFWIATRDSLQNRLTKQPLRWTEWKIGSRKKANDYGITCQPLKWKSNIGFGLSAGRTVLRNYEFVDRKIPKKKNISKKAHHNEATELKPNELLDVSVLLEGKEILLEWFWWFSGSHGARFRIDFFVGCCVLLGSLRQSVDWQGPASVERFHSTMLPTTDSTTTSHWFLHFFEWKSTKKRRKNEEE